MSFYVNRRRGGPNSGGLIIPYTPIASFFVWVKDPSTVNISAIGLTDTVLAQVQDQNHAPMVPQPSISYTSGTPAHLTIAGNVLTSVANGTSLITAITSGFSNLTGTASVTQVLASIAVSGTAPAVGNTSQFAGNGKDSQGVTLSIQPTLTWDTTDHSKATVNSTGLVTGVATGNVSITATVGSIVGTDPITIPAAPPIATNLVWLDAAPSFSALGLTANSRAQINDQFGNPMASQAGITYNSATPSIATINSSGLVTSVANGTSDLSALYTGVTTIHHNATVSQVLASIVVSPPTPTVPNGTAQVFTKAGFDSNAQSCTVGAGAWSSSDPTDFPINASTGSCTPSVSTGSAVIKFTETSSGIFGTTSIAASAGYTLTAAPTSFSGNQADTQQLVITENGTDVTSDSNTVYSSDDITVATVDAPTISSLSYSTINQNDSAVLLTITGTNARTSGQTLSGLTTGLTQSTFTRTSATTWTVLLSASGSATLGTANLRIDDPTHGNSNTKPLTVANATPTFTSISPTTLVQSASGSYTLTGTKIRSGDTIGGLPTGVSASSLSYTSTTIICTLTATGSATLGGASLFIIDSLYGNSGNQTLTVSSSGGGGGNTLPVTSGLVLQLEITNADVTSDLALVGILHDASPTGLDFIQATSGNKPQLLTTSSPYAVPILLLGTGKFMLPAAFNSALAGGFGTVITVYASGNSTSAYRVIFGNKGSAVTGYRQFISDTTHADSPRFAVANGTTEFIFGQGATNDGILHNFCDTFSSTSVATYLDNVNVDGSADVISPNTTLAASLGCDNVTPGTLTGAVAWCATYAFNRVLTSTERGLMNTFCQTTWGTP